MRLIGLYLWLYLAHTVWAARLVVDNDQNTLNRIDAAAYALREKLITRKWEEEKTNISDVFSIPSLLSAPENGIGQNYPIIERADLNEIGVGQFPILLKELHVAPEAERRAFGRRSFGPVTRFQTKKDSGLEWVAYFYEETFVPALQTLDRLLVDCTVIEVRQEWEQEEAMKFFSSLMNIYPLSLSNMVQLITLCGSIHSQQTADQEARHLAPSHENDSTRGTNSGRNSFSTLIFPGTLWCGMKDNADKYELLGDRKELDRCCRAHDHCPVKLGSFEGRYGISSSGFTTKSHCLCELEFFRCLKGAQSQTADLIGNFYFNVLNIDCLEKKVNINSSSENQETSFRSLSPFTQKVELLYKCVEWDSNRKCRFWQKEQNANNNYVTRKFKLRY